MYKLIWAGYVTNGALRFSSDFHSLSSCQVLYIHDALSITILSSSMLSKERVYRCLGAFDVRTVVGEREQRHPDMPIVVVFGCCWMQTVTIIKTPLSIAGLGFSSKILMVRENEIMLYKPLFINVQHVKVAIMKYSIFLSYFNFND